MSSSANLNLFRNGLMLLPLGIALSDTVLGVTKVSGTSKSDSGHHHVTELTLVDRISRRFRDVQLNENIILIDPYNPKSKIIRRVKGLEKAWVKVEDDDGTEFMAFIPKGYLWLEHSDSKLTEAEYDSKDFGPVPKGLVLGRPVGTLWRMSSRSIPVATQPEDPEQNAPPPPHHDE